MDAARTRDAGDTTATAAAPSRRHAAIAGLLANAAALGLGELAGGLVPWVARPIVVIGDRVVDLAPPLVKDAAVAVLGTADKPALLIGIAVLSAAAGAGLGVLARHRFGLAAAGFAAFGLLGVAAAAADTTTSVVATALALAVAVAAALLLLRRMLEAASPAPSGQPRAPDEPPAFDRRRFFRMAAGAGALAAAGIATGRLAPAGPDVEEVRSAVALPPPTRPLPPAPAGARLTVDGLSPLFVPNQDFYRIDTALAIPKIDPGEWSLDFTGMVSRPFTLTYDDLLDEPLEEGDITLACVSNEVGGRLVGNARWLGVPLPRLLERAGVAPGATQIVGRSVDGFTVGFPTDVALDGRQAMVAVGMNGEPLPAKHGFPARLVVPGLFGYVSATKWLAEIELTTWDAFDAYWVPRGWDKTAPVLTQSRIDVPATGARLTAGEVQVAGVAWQTERGVSAVEVAVDDGEWRPAELADALSDSAWRQWRYRWDATPGSHRLAVRAADGNGQYQTSVRMGPRPFGATGYHTISVRVDEA